MIWKTLCFGGGVVLRTVLSEYCSVLPWWKPVFLRRFAPDCGTSRSTSPDLDLSRCVVYRYLSCYRTPTKSMWKPGRTKGFKYGWPVYHFHNDRNSSIHVYRQHYHPPLIPPQSPPRVQDAVASQTPSFLPFVCKPTTQTQPQYFLLIARCDIRWECAYLLHTPLKPYTNFLMLSSQDLLDSVHNI